ncbi:MAG: tRNA/rRNA methyltransferase (SpoU) [Ignavibacteria bacterium]|nr:MAG: tRNA/rRNA methyltransferase (SpoU) [Ignavibacteria bacterium]KAF0157614.1 MAG: tRNA/rRNA methyltransferase (SpoU) [Ignavibacteria bacterium]
MERKKYICSTVCEFMTKAEIKYYASLSQKKCRVEESKFLVEGIKLINEAINSGYYCEAVFYSSYLNSEEEDFVDSLRERVTKIVEVRRDDIERFADTKSPQQVAAVFYNDNNHKEIKGNLIVALENINDPGNLGSIIRNSDWFGVETVILSENCAEVFSPKVIRASAGSVFHINVVESKDFYNQLNEFVKQEYKICVADLSGEDIYSYKHSKKTVLVLANETHGPSEELLSLCDTKVTIPKRGKAESLNVANASAIILSELTN